MAADYNPAKNTAVLYAICNINTMATLIWPEPPYIWPLKTEKRL
jgi:hypothetical protein